MSPFLSYKQILAIVIVELTFAFSVGLVCVIFSYNLLRAVQLSQTNVLIARNSQIMNEVRIEENSTVSIVNSF